MLLAPEQGQPCSCNGFISTVQDVSLLWPWLASCNAVLFFLDLDASALIPPVQVLAAVIPRRTREQLMLFTRKQRAEAAEALLQVSGWAGGSCSCVHLKLGMLELC